MSTPVRPKAYGSKALITLGGTKSEAVNKNKGAFEKMKKDAQSTADAFDVEVTIYDDAGKELLTVKPGKNKK